MNKQDALTALLAAQSKPKQVIEQAGDTRGTRAGMTDVPSVFSRTRDRMAAKEQVVEQEKPKDTWNESVERNRREIFTEANRRKARREQERELAEKRRLREENDRKYLKELAERNQRIFESNFIKAAIRGELDDATADEVLEVVRRVKAERCERLPEAYGIHLRLLREEKSGK
jgi:hypothetical protein